MSNNILLEDIIYPVRKDDFVATYWEQRVLHIENRQEIFKDIMELEELENLIAFHGRSGQPAFSVANAGPVSPRHSSEPLTDARREFNSGETLLVPDIHLRSPAFARLCRNFEDVFRHPVGATLVLGPPGKQGLSPHYDSAAVFALQISGSKTWHVAEPVKEAPVFGDPDSDIGQMPDSVEEYELRAGDMLYIPMGFPHIAKTGSETSLHVSVYVNAIRTHDMIAKALKLAIESDAVFRRPLRPGLLASSGGAQDLESIFKSVIEQLQESTNLEELHAELVRSFLGQMAPLPRDNHHWNTPELTSATQLVHAPGMISFATISERESSLIYPGGYTTGPKYLAETFKFIASTQQFLVSEIPGLDKAGQSVLAARLFNDGVLTMAPNPTKNSRPSLTRGRVQLV